MNIRMYSGSTKLGEVLLRVIKLITNSRQEMEDLPIILIYKKESKKDLPTYKCPLPLNLLKFML